MAARSIVEALAVIKVLTLNAQSQSECFEMSRVKANSLAHHTATATAGAVG